NIAYRAQRLNSDLEEVRRTLTMRSDFVANASHELRSPLTSIMGFAEMLDEGLADTPEEREICVRTIRGECQRMLDVVEDVLLLSRAERDQGQALLDVRVENIAEEVCQALSPQAAQKNISIYIEGELELRAAEKDVWEILHNLTGNAIRYGRQDGQVKITLGDCRISVEDNGIGIAPEHLPHLFEQFYRVDQSRDPNVRGTGLGLSIVRALAERSGGSVAVESQPGRGSRFTVTFTKEESQA
ncbi:MAG: HAMP domain-containing sensor histidine kinase, partial [Eubacteriales bacterium]|nr:HAMP domain-containing sensor histidine kinase [Eubacteriales bacterium]